jgi:hypothetical protein
MEGGRMTYKPADKNFSDDDSRVCTKCRKDISFGDFRFFRHIKDEYNNFYSPWCKACEKKYGKYSRLGFKAEEEGE